MGLSRALHAEHVKAEALRADVDRLGRLAAIAARERMDARTSRCPSRLLHLGRHADPQSRNRERAVAVESVLRAELRELGAARSSTTASTDNTSPSCIEKLAASDPRIRALSARRVRACASRRPATTRSTAPTAARSPTSTTTASIPIGCTRWCGRSRPTNPGACSTARGWSMTSTGITAGPRAAALAAVPRVGPRTVEEFQPGRHERARAPAFAGPLRHDESTTSPTGISCSSSPTRLSPSSCPVGRDLLHDRPRDSPHVEHERRHDRPASTSRCTRTPHAGGAARRPSARVG